MNRLPLADMQCTKSTPMEYASTEGLDHFEYLHWQFRAFGNLLNTTQTQHGVEYKGKREGLVNMG